METFTSFKKLIINPAYQTKRVAALQQLNFGLIDPPIINLIQKINAYPFCYTLQCCCGHFLNPGQMDEENLDPIPQTDTITEIDYRIAYIAVCVENSKNGQLFLERLKQVTQIDPQYIQFGCADWFWEQHVNSYALQVEPDRFKNKDRVFLDYDEALHVEKVRNRFLDELKTLNVLEID